MVELPQPARLQLEAYCVVEWLLVTGSERGLVSGSGSGSEKDLVQASERGLVSGSEKRSEKRSEKGLGSGLEQELAVGLDLAMEMLWAVELLVEESVAELELSMA